MVRGRKVAIVNLDEFDRAVQTISCAHILTRYEHLAEYANAQDLMNLDAFARKGNCQFAHNCRHCKPSCKSNVPPDKITFGIPKVPKVNRRNKEEDPKFDKNSRDVHHHPGYFNCLKNDY